MSTVTKKDLISQFSQEMDLPVKSSALLVNSLLGLIIKNLAEGNEVDLTGFGKFCVKSRAARNGISPLTREVIVIPPSMTVKFTVKKGLRDAVNAPVEDCGSQNSIQE